MGGTAMIIEALSRYYNSHLPNVDIRGGVITKWGVEGIPQPNQQTIDEALTKYTAEVATPSLIDKIAYSKIINIAPEYMQRNMIARSVELTDKKLTGAALTEEEVAEEAYMKGIWDRVKALRSHAQYLKNESIAGNDPDINAGWSE